MRRKSPRAICLDILNRVQRSGRHPDTLLSDSFKQYRYLSPLDRAFLTELTYGVLRWRERLDWVVRHFSKTPFDKIELEILNILRLSLYQILFLTRTPVSAAVNESVEMAKQVRGSGGGSFVNGLLRSYLRRREEVVYPNREEDPSLHISILQSHPLWLVKRWVEEMGLEETLEVCKRNNQISPLTLRANTLKINRDNLIEKLREKELNPISTPCSNEGVILKEPPPTSDLPYLKEGLYMIQDEASQLVTSILDPKPGERVLDACAGTGGKTTHMAQRMGNEGEVWALDLNGEKLSQVEEMCHRMGIRIVKTRKGDASKEIPIAKGLKFDRILADVPCSGFGTLRKNPDLKWGRGEEDIRRLSGLQLSILKNLSFYLKKGGVLVYSTCTIFREENEGVVERFLEEHLEYQLDSITNVLPEQCHSFISKGYFKTFYPRNGMDGFFVARMIKGETNS